MTYADIILPVPLDGLFTYSVPAPMEGQVRFGVRVLVPFGPKITHVGVVARVHGKAPEGIAVRDILRVLDTEPVVTATQYRLWQWMADYYMAPIGDVLKAALPAGLKAEEGYKPRTELYVRLRPEFGSARGLHVALDMIGRADRQRAAFETYLSLSGWAAAADSGNGGTVAEVTRDELLNASHTTTAIVNALVKRGLLDTYTREVGRLNTGGEPDFTRMKQLGEAQQRAYNEIMFSFLKKNVVLLHGVTSSGKTEIYIHLIKQAIESHKQVLYLLPEIALTVQITERLRRVFGGKLGIYHSRYSDNERVEIWRKQLSAAPYDVILGARSAVLLPFARLGLVIVDEEHEQSFKQQDPAPRYHARSTAIMLAQMTGAKTLLGTATPSLESYHSAQTGKYGLVRLAQRYKGIELPEIRIVDVKDLRRRKMMKGPLSPLLMAKVREAVEGGRQAILFQNRRGFAPMVECRQCGWVPRCQSCDVSLTFHRHDGRMACHYCGASYPVPRQCPQCGGTDLHGMGFGTEKIEEAVRGLFPDARTARMDLDTTRSRSAYERMLADFAAGRTDVLIGTQMVSKGLDFSRVRVVGILSADTLMNFPDFRAHERAFQLMTQVAGRAGRRGEQGLVVLQTNQAEHPLIRLAHDFNYPAMVESQLTERRLFHYPPYYRLITLVLRSRDEAVLLELATLYANKLRERLGHRVLGPVSPPVARVQTFYIRQVVIKVETTVAITPMRAFLEKTREAMRQHPLFKKLLIHYDVDPV